MAGNGILLFLSPQAGNPPGKRAATLGLPPVHKTHTHTPGTFPPGFREQPAKCGISPPFRVSPVVLSRGGRDDGVIDGFYERLANFPCAGSWRLFPGLGSVMTQPMPPSESIFTTAVRIAVRSVIPVLLCLISGSLAAICGLYILLLTLLSNYDYRSSLHDAIRLTSWVTLVFCFYSAWRLFRYPGYKTLWWVAGCAGPITLLGWLSGFPEAQHLIH